MPAEGKWSVARSVIDITNVDSIEGWRCFVAGTEITIELEEGGLYSTDSVKRMVELLAGSFDRPLAVKIRGARQ